MPIIKVKEGFSAEIRGKRVFYPAGEHELTEKELKHWRIKCVIAQGRAELVPEDQAEDGPAETKASGPSMPLADMTKKQLLARAAELGVDVAPNANKPTIIAAILDKVAH